MGRFGVWGVWACVGLLGGCAGVSHSPVASSSADRCVNGIRYYQNSLYLLVYSDGKGGIVSEFMYLPDTTKKMVACPHNFAADLDGLMRAKMEQRLTIEDLNSRGMAVRLRDAAVRLLLPYL